MVLIRCGKCSAPIGGHNPVCPPLYMAEVESMRRQTYKKHIVMRKHLLFLLPVMAILLAACSKGYSLEMINADYVTNTDKILNAEGENITIKVTSTHSYVMSSTPSDALAFSNNGVVKYTKEGVAIVELKHEVQVNPNPSANGREVMVIARHRNNPDMVASLLFFQPGQLKVDYTGTPDAVLDAKGASIKLHVSSTQPYVMTSVPEGVCRFENNGVVDFDKEGVNFHEQDHDVLLNANDSEEEREVRICVKHRDNQQISTYITLRQHGRSAE